jgi:nucleotide-binding universal stress UspA family protein
MKKILVGVDGSKESLAAVHLATELAKETHSEMVLACAIKPAAALWGAPDLTPRASQQETRERATAQAAAHELAPRASEREARERETAQAAARELAANVPDAVNCAQQVLLGNPAVALADFAKEGGFDLIVVGHRERNAVSRALHGSVADQLAQISPVPVLISR